MRKSTFKTLLRHLHPSDLRSVAHLATQATLNVTSIVEGVHQSVLSTLGLPGAGPGKTGGLTGLVYRSVHEVTHLVGKGIEQGLQKLEHLLDVDQKIRPGTPQREAVLAALNGVMGDYLFETHSVLATTMTLRYQGQALNWSALPAMPQANGKILVLIHGLCMNDFQWRSGEPDTGHDTDYGMLLAEKCGYTPLYLRYNTGLHVSQNGDNLAELLEQLIKHWPFPVSEISVVAHSMGGLLIRSAYYVAQKKGFQWPKYLKHCVFLGTPHHGAPLERVGNWIDVLLSSTPYSAPIGKLAQLRSAGITDLRYGFLVDEDWHGRDRFLGQPDQRLHVPLPESVACYTVAATMGEKRSVLGERLTGDGLVPIRSALGEHDEAERCLHFAPENIFIVYQVNHMQLLNDPAVADKIVTWFRGN